MLRMIIFSIPMPWMASFIPIRRQDLSMRSPHRDRGWSINLENKNVMQKTKASAEMRLTTKSCNHQNLVFYTWLKTSESGILNMDIIPAACLSHEFWHSRSALMGRHYYRCHGRMSNRQCDAESLRAIIRIRYFIHDWNHQKLVNFTCITYPLLVYHLNFGMADQHLCVSIITGVPYV